MFEGIDGAGKSLQIKLCKRYLEDANHSVVVTHEPNRNSETGRKIYTKLHAGNVDQFDLALLYACDRLENVSVNIKPALLANKIVLTDRYYYSTFAYQGGIVPYQNIWVLNSGFPKPDIVFILKISESTLQNRLKNKVKDSFEKDLQYLLDVQDRYLTMKDHEYFQGTEFVILDGESNPYDIASRVCVSLVPLHTNRQLYI